ncbi:MAG: MFS transporter [Pirellulaceae bacterium]
MYLCNNAALRLATLCVLYVSQGIPFGFVTVTLAAYLSQQGATTEQVALLLTVSLLPWSFKWIWGPVIDRFTIPSLGRRRPWILLAQTLMVITIVAVVLIPDLTRHWRWLCGMVLLHNVFSSLQDVSVDAMAVDLVPEKERGRANGLMYGSAYFGSLIGGALLGWLLARAGLATALTVQGAILLLIMMFPLLLRERPGDRLFPWTAAAPTKTPPVASNDSLLKLFRRLLAAFSLRAALAAAALALLVKLGAGLVMTVVVVFTVNELGWKQEEFSAVMGGGGVVTGLTGAMLGGFLIDLVGLKRLITFCSLALAAVWIGFACAQDYWHQRTVVYGMIYAQEFLLSALSVSLFALFMGVSSPIVAGTQFTAYMALLNLSNSCGVWLAGQLHPGLSVAAVYTLAGGLQIAALLLVLFIKPRDAADEKKFDSTIEAVPDESSPEGLTEPREETPPNSSDKP